MAGIGQPDLLMIQAGHRAQVMPKYINGTAGFEGCETTVELPYVAYMARSADSLLIAVHRQYYGMKSLRTDRNRIPPRSDEGPGSTNCNPLASDLDLGAG